MSKITTHVLNTSEGSPASGMKINLYFMGKDIWELAGSSISDKDGRISDLLPDDKTTEPGVYRMVFDTGDYFKELGVYCFYPVVEIFFEVSGKEHYHIPLLISPFGYTTYRGS
jgi:5-hydroxyisourate hydrolase